MISFLGEFSGGKSLWIAIFGGLRGIKDVCLVVAASLLTSGSTTTVGFDGYIGSSRLDASLAGEDSMSFLECFWLFYFDFGIRNYVYDSLYLGNAGHR